MASIWRRKAPAVVETSGLGAFPEQLPPSRASTGNAAARAGVAPSWRRKAPAGVETSGLGAFPEQLPTSRASKANAYARDGVTWVLLWLDSGGRRHAPGGASGGRGRGGPG